MIRLRYAALAMALLMALGESVLAQGKGGGKPGGPPPGGGGRPPGGPPSGGGTRPPGPPPGGGTRPPPAHYPGYAYRGYPYYGGFYSPFYLGFGFGSGYGYGPYYSSGPQSFNLYIPQPYVVSPPVIVQPRPVAFINVTVPTEDAEVWLGNSSTVSKGLTRLYESPPLEAGQGYTYTIKARWMENGKPVEQSREVAVAAGQTSTLDFTQPQREVLPSPEKKK